MVALILASARPALIVALSVSTIAAGTSFGATTPNQITIRPRPDDGFECDVAGRSRPVLDDERAAQLLGEPLGNQASVDVVCAAGRKTNDDAHRPQRIIF